MVPQATSSERGSYPKGKARRQQILDSALEVFARSGFHSGSLREIARRVGLTNTGVMHHFASKEELFIEVLRERDERVREAAGDISEQTLVEQTRAVVEYNQSTRGLTSLYTVVSAEATDNEHPAHDYFVQRYADARAHAEKALADAAAHGLIRDGVDVALAARLIPAVMDGLQQQWLLDDNFDMVAAFDEFLRGYLHP